MTHVINCWEFFNCGREPGGLRAEELGVCPVAIDLSKDGINEGRAAGRCCWETTDGNNHHVSQSASCASCAFRKRVSFERAHPSHRKDTPITT